MKFLKPLYLLIPLILAAGCGENPDNPDAKPGLKVSLSYDKSPAQDFDFSQKGDQAIYENAHPMILPAKIPTEMNVIIQSKSDWKASSLHAFISVEGPEGNKTRDLQVQVTDANGDQNACGLVLQGLKNLIPDGPGWMGLVTLEVSSASGKQVLQIHLATPPAVPHFLLTTVFQKDRVPLWISPSISVIPVMRFDLANTSHEKWNIVVPYAPPVQVVQKVKEIKYQTTGICGFKTEAEEREDVAASKFFLIRSTILYDQFPKYIGNQSTPSEMVTLAPQESAQWTLYLVSNSVEVNPTHVGRKWTAPPQSIAPSCKNGYCAIRLAYETYPTLSYRSCSPKDVLSDDGKSCKHELRGVCDSESDKCDFHYYNPALLQMGKCIEYYQEPVDKIDFSDYIDVLETHLHFLPKFFADTQVYYTDSPHASSEQSTVFPWILENYPLEFTY